MSSGRPPCEREAVRIARRQWFWMDLLVWAAISVFLFVIWWLAGGGSLVRDRRRRVGHRHRRPRRLRLRAPQSEDILLERERRGRSSTG